MPQDRPQARLRRHRRHHPRAQMHGGVKKDDLKKEI